MAQANSVSLGALCGLSGGCGSWNRRGEVAIDFSAVGRRPLDSEGASRATRVEEMPASGPGAAPISADLLAWFHGIGIPIYEGFGQTESAGLITMNCRGAFDSDHRWGRSNAELRLAGDGEILPWCPHL